MAIGDQANVFTRIRNGLPHWFGDVTPILDALIQGLANSGAFVYSLYAYAKLQTRIKTATDGWLDMIAADFFGSTIQRSANQTDASFRATIMINMFRERATRNAIIKVLQDITGRTPIIIEPQRPADVGAYGAAVAVSRATIATYIDGNGIVRTAAANQVRYQNNALLLEGAATNYLSYSEQFDQSPWFRGNCTIAPNAAVAPDGKTTADAVVRTATGNHYLGQNLTALTAAGKPFTASVYLKSGSYTGLVRVWLKDGAGVSLAINNVQPTTVWQRFNVSGTYPSGATSYPAIYLDPSDDVGVAGDTFYCWGAQVEDGLQPTSYIPTPLAAAVTRAADILLNNMAAGSAALGGYGVAGAYGSILLPYQAFVQAFRPSGSGIPFVAGYGVSTGGYGVASRADYASILQVTGAVTDADIYNAIDSVKPAGTTLWTKINA